MTTTVLIADDQALMRAALRMYLDNEVDLTVVGEAGDGAETVQLALRLRPNVVVMDVRMPVMDGIEATRRIVQEPGPPIRVLVITTFDLDEYIVEALRAGASGFLIKDSTPEELIHAVRVIAAGHAMLSPPVTKRLLDLRAAMLQPIAPAPSHQMASAHITNRELDVLKLVARGMSNAEIALTLNLAQSSVKTHVGHLLAKLGMTDRVQLTVFAYEKSLIFPGMP
jgi:DNA-binding NarL/FixJ family response regulator